MDSCMLFRSSMGLEKTLTVKISLKRISLLLDVYLTLARPVWLGLS